MTNLKKLGAAVLLICLLGLSAFADCPAPGIMGAPPCMGTAEQVPDDSTVAHASGPGQMGTPPAVSVSAAVDPVSVVEFALNLLPLF